MWRSQKSGVNLHSFFFSSRRRHTRFDCDWSSDVCSSDLVERDSQKKILIGHKGEMLKKIGTEARKELEALLDSKIYLGLFVKVVPDWRESPQKNCELGWHF